MSRAFDALGRVNPVLLVITLAVVAGASFHWCWTVWSRAAEAAEDEFEREYRELLDTHGRGSS